MAVENNKGFGLKGISVQQILNIVSITLSVIAIVLSIIAISMKPSMGFGNCAPVPFKNNQFWDANNANNPIDGNNQHKWGFGQNGPRNNQNWQGNGFGKGPNTDNTQKPNSPADNRQPSININ